MSHRQQRRTMKEEVERLEEQLAAREEEVDALRRTLRAFYVRYREELGPLVQKLLRIRKEQRRQSLYARRGSRRRRTALNEVTDQFERFQRVLAGEEDTPADALEPADGLEPADALEDDAQERLKALYRQASKRCHPDMVDASVEEEARRYFNELREAYQAGDLQRVASIAETLETGGFARRTDEAATSDAARREARAERLRRRIDAAQKTLDALRASRAYQVITSVSDLDAYFDEMKRALRHEMRRLTRGRSVRR